MAPFNGSLDQNEYEGVLPASGDYRIRAFLVRAAGRNEIANYRLEIIVSGDANRSPATHRDALVPGTTCHTTGNVPCSMGKRHPTGSCPFGITRQGNGSGIITETRTDGPDPGDLRRTEPGDRLCHEPSRYRRVPPPATRIPTPPDSTARGRGHEREPRESSAAVGGLETRRRRTG